MKIINKNTDRVALVNITVGDNVKFFNFVNAYHCTIGNNSKIGSFVEIQKEAVIGSNCKISSHSFICSGVEIGDNCFIGHHVVFTNDKYPRAVNEYGTIETESDWDGRFQKTLIGNNVSIGSNSTIICGVEINEGAIIGAGSVVTKSVPKNEIWAGNPAKKIRNK